MQTDDLGLHLPERVKTTPKMTHAFKPSMIMDVQACGDREADCLVNRLTDVCTFLKSQRLS